VALLFAFLGAVELAKRRAADRLTLTLGISQLVKRPWLMGSPTFARVPKLLLT
jgi:hypothetical protein